MTLVVQSADLAAEALAELLAPAAWPGETRVIAYWVAESAFTFLRDIADVAHLARAESGHVFHPQAELRWRVLDGDVRVVHLGPQPLPGLTVYDGELDGLRPECREALLWGVRTDLEDEWIEQRIPHRLRYPFRGGTIARGRLAMVIEEWRDAAGAVRLSRFVDIVEREAEHAAG